MKLSIGILAHNEADYIAKLLNSLGQQSLFTNANRSQTIEIIIVPNGCTDNTVEVANDTLKELALQINNISWQWKICEVPEAGKSNAWNLFVHKFSAIDTDFFCFMDADIQLHHENTLANMVDVLIHNPEYWISLDQPIKDVELKQNKTWLEKLSVAVSKSSNKGQLYICGQLYCGRAAPLRDIWMPAGLPVEDGFLTDMIISENFTLENPTFTKRIVRVANASHIFEAYTNPLESIDVRRFQGFRLLPSGNRQGSSGGRLRPHSLDRRRRTPCCTDRGVDRLRCRRRRAHERRSPGRHSALCREIAGPRRRRLVPLRG